MNQRITPEEFRMLKKGIEKKIVKKHKSRKRTEQDIQRAILQYLHSIGCIAFKIPSVGTYRQDTGRYIPLSTKGISDILGIYKGKPLAIEVKGIKGRLTPHQEIFLKSWNEHGGIGFPAHSIEEVIENLQIKLDK